MIVIVYSGFLRRGFGVSRHILELVTSLAEARRPTKILSLDAVPALLRYLPHLAQVVVNAAAAPFGNYVRYRIGAYLLGREYAKIARRQQVSVVIFEDIYNSFPTGVPSVSVLHALHTDNLQAFNVPQRFHRIAEWYEARRVSRSERPIVTVSEPYRRSVVEKLSRYCKTPLKIGVVPLGLRLPEAAVDHPGASSAALRLVFVGPLEPRKNTLFLIDVVERLAARGDVPFSLTLIGDGPDRQRLEAVANARHLSAYVKFLGRIEHSSVLAMLGSYHALLHPSLKESFGYSLLEAKAAGLIVIATENLEVPEDFVDVPLPLDACKWAEAVVGLAGQARGRTRASRWPALAQLRERYDSRHMAARLLSVAEQRL